MYTQTCARHTNVYNVCGYRYTHAFEHTHKMDYDPYPWNPAPVLWDHWFLPVETHSRCSLTFFVMRSSQPVCSTMFCRCTENNHMGDKPQ